MKNPTFDFPTNGKYLPLGIKMSVKFDFSLLFMTPELR